METKAVTLWQYSTIASRSMEPFHWQAAGMGYVVRTAKNRFVVIDGGHGEDAEGLIRLMQRESGKEQPEVAVWILTHPHDDHADALIKIAGNADLREKIQIHAVAFNLPEDFSQNKGADCEKTLRAIHELPEKLNCRHICPRTGDRMEADGLAFTFFFCQEDLYCEDPNELSLVFRMSKAETGEETEEMKTVMFTGDAYPRTMDVIMGKYTAEQLHSDICQAAHHGLNGGDSRFYEAVGADTVLVPIAKPAFEAMLYGEYKEDPQADANRGLMRDAIRREDAMKAAGKKLYLAADGDSCLSLERHS